MAKISKQEFIELQSRLGMSSERKIKIMGIPVKVYLKDSTRYSYYDNDVKSCKMHISYDRPEPMTQMLPYTVRNLHIKTRALSVATIRKNFSKNLISLIGRARDIIKDALDNSLISLQRNSKNDQNNAFIIEELKNSFNNEDSVSYFNNWEQSDDLKKQSISVILENESEDLVKIKKGEYEKILRLPSLDVSGSSRKYFIRDKKNGRWGDDVVRLTSDNEGCILGVNLQNIKIDPSNIELIKKAIELIQQAKGE